MLSDLVASIAEEKTVRTLYPDLDIFPIKIKDSLSALDISADLQELTRCPVGLVSSGVKSILDIGRYVVKNKLGEITHRLYQNFGISGGFHGFTDLH